MSDPGRKGLIERVLDGRNFSVEEAGSLLDLLTDANEASELKGALLGAMRAPASCRKPKVKLNTVLKRLASPVPLQRAKMSSAEPYQPHYFVCAS